MVALSNIFNLTEKEILPRLLKQPELLSFATGLKFEVFETHDLNNQRTSLFRLSEGHWAIKKSKPGHLYVVLCHSYRHRQAIYHLCHNSYIHERRWLQQTKTEGFSAHIYMLKSYLGFNKFVVLNFMVVDHTKKQVDSCFGHVKRKLKQEMHESLR